jgi:hypothetical protein
MKRIAGLFVLTLVFFGCRSREEKLVTKSVSVGDNKCIIQQIPASFNEGSADEESRFDYFRVILESKAKLTDSSHVNYVNFGMESAMRMVIGKDTVSPAIVQRIANGKKENYEYMVAFEKNVNHTPFEILINDNTLEIGQVSLKF